MRKTISVPMKHNTRAHVRAIVRGDLALHRALRVDGKVLNEWAVTYVPTGQQIIVVRGACAGRIAFRELATVSFATIDAKLMRRCNAVVKRLRERRVTVLFPHLQRYFVAINEPVEVPA